MPEDQLQYRVGWSASSNVSFRDEGDWHDAEPGETTEEIEAALSTGGGSICDGLEMVINESGFEWYVETREKGESE